MVNGLLIAEVKLPLAAVRFLEPTRSTLRSPKVARPVPSVVWLMVPLKAPVPLLRVIVTETPALGALFPKASFSCAVTAGAIAAPAVALVGCCAKAN